MDELRNYYGKFVYHIAAEGWFTNRERPSFLAADQELRCFPAFGVYQGELWGVLNLQCGSHLSDIQANNLKTMLYSEFEDGYGEMQRLSCFDINDETRLSLDFFIGDDYFLTDNEAKRLLEGVDFFRDWTEQKINNPMDFMRVDTSITIDEKSKLLDFAGRLIDATWDSDYHNLTPTLNAVFNAQTYREAFDALIDLKIAQDECLFSSRGDVDNHQSLGSIMME